MKKALIVAVIAIISSLHGAQTLFELPLSTEKTIILVSGNLLAQPAQALVNPANEYLSHGGGVAAALANFFPDLHHVSNAIPSTQKSFYTATELVRCPVGTACTTAIKTNTQNRNVTHIIHAVGPKNHDRTKKALLASAYTASLQQATANNLETIAFPPLSIGIFNYPLQEATTIAVATIVDYLQNSPSCIKTVYLVIWPGDKRFDEIVDAYTQELHKHMKV